MYLKQTQVVHTDVDELKRVVCGEEIDSELICGWGMKPYGLGIADTVIL